MATNRSQRSTAWFWFMLAVTLYVLVSASLAVATANDCDGPLAAEKTWQLFPPHWECASR
jgi:hypothetical protein